MAALTSQTITGPVAGGITPSAVAVSASDTIAQAQFGPSGVIVRVINGGGSPDTVTVVDPGTTNLGSSPTNPTITVANGTTKEFFVPISAINSAGVATIQHSFTTSVTCEVKRVN